tara:strand:- start:328 stop:1152 length:825 start_codon:yes stop_codon:yes gene_type:complete
MATIYVDGHTFDNLMICEGVSASIIENYDIINMYLCTQCGDEIKNGINTTKDDVMRHVMTHMYTGIAGIYMCDICNAEFKTDAERKEHNEEHNEDIVDEKKELKYDCPTCGELFYTQVELGEHFIEEHGDYDELGMLDKTESESYPTFEVLYKIGMSRFISIYDDIKETECSICCSKYTGRIRGNTVDDYTNNTDDKYFRFNCDMKLLYINKKYNLSVNPIKLMCCNVIMCSNCLIQHIKSKKGEPECPYCRKNHTQYGKQYIIFDERPKNKNV